MANPRLSKQKKTLSQQRQYKDNFIKPEEIPTDVDHPSLIEPTDQVPREPEGQIYQTRSTVEDHKILDWVSKNWLNLAFSAGLTIIGGLLLWYLTSLGNEIYTLNRQIGEISKDLESVQAADRQIQDDIKESERRVKNDIDDLDSEIEKLEGRFNTSLLSKE